jgi:hypothetical protein
MEIEDASDGIGGYYTRKKGDPFPAQVGNYSSSLQVLKLENGDTPGFRTSCRQAAPWRRVRSAFPVAEIRKFNQIESVTRQHELLSAQTQSGAWKAERRENVRLRLGQL